MIIGASTSSMLKHVFKPTYASLITVRRIKTLHTPVFTTDNNFTKSALLEGVRLLDDILNSSSHENTLLYTSKYMSKPQLITSENQIQMQHVIREFLDRWQIEEASMNRYPIDVRKKLGKIGLQLYLGCNDMNLSPIGTTLTRILMEQYNRCPERETLEGIQRSINLVRAILKQNKLIIRDKKSINALVEKMTNTEKDCATLRRALQAVDYKLVSDETIRIVKGRKTFDELELSKGWRFPAGLFDTNEAYSRSIGLPEKKLIDVSEDMLVLVFDGTLRDANKILPTINYASKIEKSLLLIINGDCVGDALMSITINNNKNKRKGNKSKTLIIKYNSAANGNLSLQENNDLIKFLKLPKGFGSIYSPEFSSYVPSKMCSDLYYGKLESIKATNGEAFLYNSMDWKNQDSENKFLQVTVTLRIGGHSEFEINHRRAHLDNLINNILCVGLSDGFVPTYGVALAKTIPSIDALKKNERNLKVRGALDSCITAFSAPMEIAMKNAYGYSRFEISKIVSETIESRDFLSAKIEADSAEVQNFADLGFLEPWKKLDQCLANVLSFVRLLDSCQYIVARVFEKPKKGGK